ncbi:MAG: cyclase family protein [Halobacteriaceae archaeon]
MQELSHRVSSGMPTYPGDPSVDVESVAEYDRDGYRNSRLICGTHAGTHVDAPAHTEAGGRSLDSYPPSAFVRQARLVDCSGLAAGTAVSADAVPAVGPEIDCLLFYTGWDEHWGSEQYRDHPFLSPAAAQRCAAQGVAVGIDTFGPDPTASARESGASPTGYPAHHAILGSGTLLFENLTKLGELPMEVELRALPLRVPAEAAPVRAVAVW